MHWGGSKKREERHWSAAVFPFFVLFGRFHLAFLPGLCSLRSGVRWPRASKQQRAVNSLFTTIPDELHQRRETLWFLLAFLLFLFIRFFMFSRTPTGRVHCGWWHFDDWHLGSDSRDGTHRICLSAVCLCLFVLGRASFGFHRCLGHISKHFWDLKRSHLIVFPDGNDQNTPDTSQIQFCLRTNVLLVRP